MDIDWVDIVGYLASIFVVMSFVLKDVHKIRMINLIGCLCFVVYGFYAGVLWPIIIPNAVLSFIQLYHIIRK